MVRSVPQQTAMFESVARKPVNVEFSEPDLSTSGGAILLKQLDESMGLTRRVAGCLCDGRDESRVEFALRQLLQQRVFAICCGYEDANDAARYRDDGMQKLLCDRSPTAQGGLASQPTLSRFENSVSRIELYRMSEEIADLVIARHAKRLGRKGKRVTIDLDATVNETHGQQQLTLFNGFYDSWCYLPLMAFVSFNDEPDQYLVSTCLRPGKPGSSGVVGLLRRLIATTRRRFPKAEIIVRMDAGFCGAPILDLLDELKVQYLVGYGANSVLTEHSYSARCRARRAFETESKTRARYGSTDRYRARSWKRKRRVVYRAEVIEHPGRNPKEDVRYLVTNMRGKASDLYRQYAARGDSENRIKEAKLGVHSDRMSCSRFEANQFRALLSTIALVLFQELRLRARGTAAARWQVPRIRTHLIQIAARVSVSTRRFLIRMPRGHPWAALWARLALATTR